MRLEDGFLDATNVNIAKEITKALGLSGDAEKVVTNAVNTARKSARFASVVGFVGVVTVGTSFTNEGLIELVPGIGPAASGPSPSFTTTRTSVGPHSSASAMTMESELA